MSNTLPVSSIVRVSVDLEPSAGKSQSLDTLLVLADSPVIDTVERYRIYEDLTSVATDLGTTGPHYLAAAAYFGQLPQPQQIMLGRWVQTASKGKLVGATLSTAQQALSNFTVVAAGSFNYAKNGAAAADVTGVNLTGALNLNNVASIITAATTGVVVTWNAQYSRFEVESTTTGTTSAVPFFAGAATGTPIQAALGLTAASSGAYTVQGQAAETALDAATLFDQNYGQLWYALEFPTAVSADHVAVAGFIEGTDTKHIYTVNTQEAGALVPSNTANVGYLLSQLGYKKTMVQFSSNSQYAAASLAGRAITTNFQGNNTVITLKFKQEPGVVPEALNTTQASALKGFNTNVFVNYDNDTSIIQEGVMSSGDFIDVITGTDWLATDIKNAVFDLLYSATTKIAQTDSDVHLIVTTIESRCSQAVSNGLVAPGIWNNNGFGKLKQGDLLAAGYYVYAVPVAQQSLADRTARKAPPIMVAVKLAGAVHSVDVEIRVNR